MDINTDQGLLPNCDSLDNLKEKNKSDFVLEEVCAEIVIEFRTQSLGPKKAGFPEYLLWKNDRFFIFTRNTVLCHSRKYPLKEPFVQLLKSLDTFPNAFTYRDRTCYPVASTNSKDFYNLIDVYLDAVFFPKYVKDFQTFQHKGCHSEHHNLSEDIL